ncbi:MAG TPA: tRNA preQ1(34) S-adenosylmethionine ribosyltransferase-isomerase QueA [Patescibacteria group bacterium]|nr:tRNA preQ1(34) S-adenosylmethionine ribosyltransferase-isomerase QueA [Patescibacteria group bacterium]
MKQLTLHDFDYNLPEDRIAQHPVVPRDQSKLLVVDRKKGSLTHRVFADLPSLLLPTDILVLNNTKTIPVRTHGKKTTGGDIEVLFIKPLSKGVEQETWEVLTKPGLKVEQTVSFPNSSMQIQCLRDKGYTREVIVSGQEDSVLDELKHIGELPTPHYIHEHLQDPSQYQTIYATQEGSSATPTAGLHFTQSVFDELDKKGIQRIELTLHVGLGTFLPVKVENIKNHVMHAEWFTLSKTVADNLNTWKGEGRRIIAVGTTSTRVLESCTVWDKEKKRYALQPKTGETALYIHPPHQFTFVDAMITNFHLPKSTLLMLVSAFCSQNQLFTSFQDSLAGKAYALAIQQGYRFFSFGDAMLIV